MGRVFVFNQHTKELLPSDLGADAEFNLNFDSQNPLAIVSSLLQIDRNALLLTPASTPGFTCVIHVRVAPQPALLAQPEAFISDGTALDPIPLELETTTKTMYEATGFLGLIDSVRDSDPPRPRRWWHWFWS